MRCGRGISASYRPSGPMPSMSRVLLDHVPAIPLPDHRSIYLEFEGPLSGDRGTVQQCDRGSL